MFLCFPMFLCSMFCEPTCLQLSRRQTNAFALALSSSIGMRDSPVMFASRDRARLSSSRQYLLMAFIPTSVRVDMTEPLRSSCVSLPPMLDRICERKRKLNGESLWFDLTSKYSKIFLFPMVRDECERA